MALSPAAKEKLLDAAATRNQNLPADPGIGGFGRRVQGEVGFMVGTGGSRGVFGSAVAPIGETGSVAVAFENSRYRRYR